jgi:hypothetical protein
MGMLDFKSYSGEQYTDIYFLSSPTACGPLSGAVRRICPTYRDLVSKDK